MFAPLAADAEARDSKLADEQEPAQSLSLLDQGEGITCGEVSIADRHTAPPKRFTDASLIQAMTGIARYVHDPKIKQALHETDGIGTPATQAAIIQTLFNRRFIEKRGRQVASTQIGRALIQVLPDVATLPDMTALWEAAMRQIRGRADASRGLSVGISKAQWALRGGGKLEIGG